MLEWDAIAVSRDLPDPGTEPRLPALQADASEPPGGAQVATVIKSLPAGAKDSTDVGLSLGQEDSLEKEMTTHSSILAWEIP